jgi:hypothetical protein
MRGIQVRSLGLFTAHRKGTQRKGRGAEKQEWGKRRIEESHKMKERMRVDSRYTLHVRWLEQATREKHRRRDGQ